MMWCFYLWNKGFIAIYGVNQPKKRSNIQADPHIYAKVSHIY